MNCWHCERPAHGACIFCGRAVCKEHAQEMPHIVALYRDARNSHKAIVTARALFCGVCEPREDPVEIPALSLVCYITGLGMRREDCELAAPSLAPIPCT